MLMSFKLKLIVHSPSRIEQSKKRYFLLRICVKLIFQTFSVAGIIVIVYSHYSTYLHCCGQSKNISRERENISVHLYFKGNNKTINQKGKIPTIYLLQILPFLPSYIKGFQFIFHIEMWHTSSKNQLKSCDHHKYIDLNKNNRQERLKVKIILMNFSLCKHYVDT